MERTREKRALARELHPEGLLPTAEADDGDCRHGCNGDCEASGSDLCNFTCHGPDVPPGGVPHAWSDWLSPEDRAYDDLDAQS